MRFTVRDIDFQEGGTKIVYNYEMDRGLQKYFNLDTPLFAKYDVDVSMVPLSIAIIPLVTNIIPIAWYAGFQVYIDELDNEFYHSLPKIKEEFAKRNNILAGGLNVESLIHNPQLGDNTALLFSGGVDAYTTLFRNFDRNPDLITILGADIEIDDTNNWNEVVTYNESGPTSLFLPANQHDKSRILSC